MEHLILECTVKICTQSVGVKIFKEDGKDSILESFSFSLSDYFRNDNDAAIYYPSNRDNTLEGCISMLRAYMSRFTNIAETEKNKQF